MPLPYAKFLGDLRKRLWPFDETIPLQFDHNGCFVDALLDLQSLVPCLKQDQTDLVPHCNTVYNCGLTVFDAPTDEIVSLSVVDRINPTTHKEDAVSPIDWCSEIAYQQVDFCHIRSYLDRSQRAGCCLSIPFFFGIPSDLCAKANFPIPTDEGVAKSLPVLPLGFHYAQTSTDRKHGRAHAGRWAIERGKIWVAPWIQSTELVILKWDGIKRQWGDDDPIADDPMLANAVLEFARWKHADKWDKDESEMLRGQAEYVRLRTMLIRQCREATRVRGCGGDAGTAGSQARSSPSSITQLFFNSEQKATAQCPSGQTGNPVTETIPAGTVSSTVSKADADKKARDQAQTQAKARLDCKTQATIYQSDPVIGHASCVQDAGAPIPDGNPVTVSLPAGAATSTVSVADATAIAQTQADAAAKKQLVCTFWNREQIVTAVCQSNNAITATKTVAAHTFSSMVSQADADTQAHNEAQTEANQALADAGCTDGNFWNTEQIGQGQFPCTLPPQGTPVLWPGRATVKAHAFNGPTQLAANQRALDYARQLAQQAAFVGCSSQTVLCVTYPPFEQHAC